MNFTFILVNTAVPENVGASARAMNTMGFSNLRLVNPCDYLNDKARMLAHGSHEILENAEVYESLEGAIKDLDFIIGSTAKIRSAQQDYYPVHHLPDLLENKGKSISKIALVFGREESGLTNDEIRLCDLITTIPMKTTYPSLNLSQAVMMYAYFLSGFTSGTDDAINSSLETASLLPLKQRITEILALTPIYKNKTLYHRIMERVAILGEDDIHLLHSITDQILTKLKEKPLDD